MTRINLINPAELIDKHLLAEYRELPRVFNLAHPCNDAPQTYVMGTGHVKFFYNKLSFLKNRQRLIIAEMKRRGFKVNFSADNLGNGKDTTLWGDWKPTEKEIAISRARIEQRKIEIFNRRRK